MSSEAIKFMDAICTLANLHMIKHGTTPTRAKISPKMLDNIIEHLTGSARIKSPEGVATAEEFSEAIKDQMPENHPNATVRIQTSVGPIDLIPDDTFELEEIQFEA